MQIVQKKLSVWREQLGFCRKQLLHSVAFSFLEEHASFHWDIVLRSHPRHLSFLFWGRCRPNIPSKKEIDLSSETKLLLKEERLLNFSSAFPDNRDWQTAWKSPRLFNVLAVNILSYIPWAVRSAGSYAITLHFWNQNKTTTSLKCGRTM